MNKWINIVSHDQPFYKIVPLLNIKETLKSFSWASIFRLFVYFYEIYLGVEWITQTLPPLHKSDSLSFSHVAIRLSIFFLSPHMASTWCIQSELFSRSPVSHSWNSKNPKNGNRKKLEKCQISRNVFLCFAHKSAVWAQFSRNDSSVLHVASIGVAQSLELN